MNLNENQYNSLKNRNDISFITFTNYGYIHYTKNLILSLEKCNFPLPLKIYCIDQKSFDELQKFKKNILLEMLNDETNTNENIIGWKGEGWNTMAFSKLKCIHKELLINPYVFYTDSDIVFEKDCLPYLIENLKDYDMLIQKNRKDYINQFCTGFMFIRSNKIMINLFDWRKINLETFVDDVDYINENKNKLKIKGLKRKYFPSQRYYCIEYKNISPFIIHFNRHNGLKKEKYMRNLKKWYLD